MIQSVRKEVADMITIKEFAKLCKCNTQTLRYYDKIDLLKPVKVDPWSGYRYYAESQAIDFIKIKNLQAADFSIREIQSLLGASDQQIFEAFDLKIKEQAQKLERIKFIQQSYLTEKNAMENVIHELTDFLTNQLTDPQLLQEFGIDPADAPTIVARIKTYMEEQTSNRLPAESDITMTINEKIIRGADQVADVIHSLNENNLHDTIQLGTEAATEESGFSPEQYETVWECHGWNYVREFIDSIPRMEKDLVYCFFFDLNEEKYSDGIDFSMFMIGAMLPKVANQSISLGCSVEKSTDGQNHFALKYRK